MKNYLTSYIYIVYLGINTLTLCMFVPDISYCKVTIWLKYFQKQRLSSGMRNQNQVHFVHLLCRNLKRSLGEAGQIEPETEGMLIENDVDYAEFSEEVLVE